jgi:hypothetical protein
MRWARPCGAVRQRLPRSGITSPPGEGPGSPRDPELLPWARHAESLCSRVPRATRCCRSGGGLRWNAYMSACAGLDVHQAQVSACEGESDPEALGRPRQGQAACEAAGAEGRARGPLQRASRCSSRICWPTSSISTRRSTRSRRRSRSACALSNARSSCSARSRGGLPRAPGRGLRPGARGRLLSHPRRPQAHHAKARPPARMTWPNRYA